MSEIEILAYRAKPGMRAKLADLSALHGPLLRRLGYVTAGPDHVLWTSDDTLLRLVKWTEGAKAKAARHPDLRAMGWDLDAVADRIDADAVPEAADLLSKVSH